MLVSCRGQTLSPPNQLQDEFLTLWSPSLFFIAHFGLIKLASVLVFLNLDFSSVVPQYEAENEKTVRVGNTGELRML